MITKKVKERRLYLKDVAVNEYLNNTNITLKELEKKYKCGKSTISRILKEEGIKIRNRYHDIKLKYNFYKIDSEESAYWLGFIYADGSITYSPDDNKTRYILEIGLAEKDKEHIEKFIFFIGSHCKITYREKTKSYRVIISSKEMIINLHNLGIIKNKTYINNIEKLWSNIPKEFQKDFIRGYFDGDGHISNNFRIALTSYNKEGIEYILNNCSLSISKYKVYHKKDSNTADIKLNQKESVLLLHFMYHNCFIYLKRKYEKYLGLPC